MFKIYNKLQSGTKSDGIFAYFNDIDQVGKVVCHYIRAEEFTQLENVLRIMKILSLYIFKKTNMKLNASTASSKEKINDIFALDIVKMVQIHIKYITVATAASKIHLFTCLKLRGHLCNLFALSAIHFIQEYKAEGYECGLFQ